MGCSSLSVSGLSGKFVARLEATSTDLPYRYKWVNIKTRKIVYNPPTNPAVRNPSATTPDVQMKGKSMLK